MKKKNNEVQAEETTKVQAEEVEQEVERTEDELLEEFVEICNKKTNIEKIEEDLGIKKYEILGLKKLAKDKGYNIVVEQTDKGVMLYNQGELKEVEDKIYEFKSDENRDFKFMAIADPMLGNKAQQLAIIKDAYKKAKEMGITTVFLCGNLTAGTYKMSDANHDSLFISDQEGQVEYFIENFPHEEGITTYFITGPKDNKGKISVGNRVAEARPDMVYLGAGSANIKIDDAVVKLMSSSQTQVYTTSYRSQQQVESFRSEDKPDIFLFGGLNQADHIYMRESDTYTVPSLCATSKEMDSKRRKNTVGALFFDIKMREPEKKKKSTRYRDNKKTKRTESIKLTTMPYYKTNKDDYQNVNIIDNSKKIIIPNEQDDELGKETAIRFYNYIKNGKSVEDFKSTFHLNDPEFYGILELCNIYGLYISVKLNSKKELVFDKGLPTALKINKPSLDADDIIVSEYLVVSDTHLCNIHQQLGICDELYDEAKKRGISTALHVGDIVDGFYPNRKAFPHQTFLEGFDDQTDYVIDNYPKYDGITTLAISGNHDKTHNFNGGATVLKWVSRMRDDIKYVGIDRADLDLDGIRIRLDHPNDGSSEGLSYASQKSLKRISSGSKPNIYITGHYHKWYEMLYNNVFAYSAPCLCDMTNFEMTHKLKPMVGGFFLKVYINKKTGAIEYIESDPRIYEENQMIDEAGLNRDQIIAKRKKLKKN